MTILPSALLDAVIEDETAVVIANRDPQPGEVQISRDAAIAFDCFEDVVDLQVYVDDILVFNGSAAPTLQSGWAGGIVPLPGNVGSRIVLFPSGPFDANARISVRAVVAEHEVIWAFDTYDWMPPIIAECVALSATTVRVAFNEPVPMQSAESGDALDPTAYTLEHVSQPAATPPVVSVERESDTAVILTTAFELSFGARYMCVVSGVTDAFGNAFLPPNNVYEFYAWLPPYPAGRRWVLHDLVPRMSLAEDGSRDLTLFLAVLQDTNNLLLHCIDRWLEIIDPDTAPEAFVDAMLVDLGNPFSFEMSLSEKRRLVKTLVFIYQMKGTAVGLISVIRFFFGIECTIETFVDRGWQLGTHQLSTTAQVADNPAIIGPGRRALYSFRLRTDVVLTETRLAQNTAIATYMKGAPEHLVGIIDGSAKTTRERYWIVSRSQVGFVYVGHAA